MNLKPIVSIEKLLKYDYSYPWFTPVVLFNHSPWRKFLAAIRKEKRS